MRMLQDAKIAQVDRCLNGEGADVRVICGAEAGLRFSVFHGRAMSDF